MPKTTYSTCYMCTTNCPITVVSEENEILSINHPDCVRAEAMLEQREGKLRWTKAKIRKNSKEPWQETSYQKALQQTAQKLLEIKERYGPESIVFAAGYTKEARPYLQRLAYSFGSPHYITESSCCFSAGYIAATTTLGKEYGYLLGPSRGRYKETQCRLIWSNNPSASQIPYETHHLLVDAPAVPTIAVDPRKTPLAEKATVHLQLRPGTDGALALGLAHLLFEENLVDVAFLEKYAYGLEEYRNYVKKFSPEKTSEITGIPKETLIEAALLYGKARPGQITISANATTHHTNGFQNHRAILLLAALCGNLDVPGGNKPWDHRLKEKSVNLYFEKRPTSSPQIGETKYPIFTDHYAEGQGMVLAEEIEAGCVKAVFSVGLNLMMWPNSKRLEKALRQLEFFSTSDFHSNPTVESSNTFFPAATHLERQALILAGNGRMQYRPAAVEPRGEAHGDTELIFALAKELGLNKEFWNGDIHASYQERMGLTSFAFKDLPENGESQKEHLPSPEPKSYLKHSFGTPTQKVEFVNTALEKAGYDGLPTYQEPYWSPLRTPELAETYPLILTSGGRSNNYTHSQGRHLETLRQREPDPRVEIHPADALSRGINDGDWVEVSSPLGSIQMKAQKTDTLQKGVVHAFHGWPQANINELIPEEGNDPISGFPCFKSSLCQVKKVSSV